MATFKYEARDESGQLVRDTIEAPNVRVAVQTLQDHKLIVISIKQPVTQKCRCGRIWEDGDTVCAECSRPRPKAPPWLLIGALIVGAIILFQILTTR